MSVAKIGFAGMGNMGQALLKAFTGARVCLPENIAVLSNSEDGKIAARDAGAAICETPAALAAFADIVIIAVKPKDAHELIRSLCPSINGKALLSIVAGLGYSELRKSLWGVKTRVLITMPNTPVQVGEGIIAFTNETDFNEEERDFAVRLFAPVAQVEWINEAQLAALAALAGSGPAYAALFAEALADGAVKEGLPRELSLRLAAKTLWGTGKLLFQGGRHPAVLKDAVCSPGGTSIEGIAALEGRAFRSALIEAVSAAASKFERLFPLNTNPDSK